MLSVEEAQHIKAVAAMGVTGLALPTAWLVEVDYILKMILTIVGIATGIYSMLYYRKRWKSGT